MIVSALIATPSAAPRPAYSRAALPPEPPRPLLVFAGAERRWNLLIYAALHVVIFGGLLFGLVTAPALVLFGLLLCYALENLMFVFEDIKMLDDRAIQAVLGQTDKKDLALALKSVAEDVRMKCMKNMSQRAAQALTEEMEFMGPVRLKDVEDAQQRIVAVIRRLEESGEIIIDRGGENAMI